MPETSKELLERLEREESEKKGTREKSSEKLPFAPGNPKVVRFKAQKAEASIGSEGPNSKEPEKENDVRTILVALIGVLMVTFVIIALVLTLTSGFVKM